MGIENLIPKMDSGCYKTFDNNDKPNKQGNGGGERLQGDERMNGSMVVNKATDTNRAE